MRERSRIREGSQGVVGHAPRAFRSLLVPLDLSPASDRVAGRVAVLPVAEDARLTLLHVVPRTLSTRAQESAQGDARKALDAEARSLGRRLPNRVHIEPVVTVGAAAVEIAKRATAAKVQLIVMGRGGRTLRDVFLGSTAERVIRRGQLPVLVVRLPPREPYRRPALALALDQPAQGMLDLLLRVVPPPRPSVEIIHAYGVPYEGVIYPSLSEDDASAYRERYRQRALHEIGKLLATALAEAKVAPVDAPLWRAHVRWGPPRTVIEKAVRKSETDLLVLGTHGYAGLAHAFLGTVAGEILRTVACDVLVVPPPRKASRKG